MSLAMSNVDVLHRGWEDAVAEITPNLPEVRASMETRFATAVRDNRLDEQSLLETVREIIGFAARQGGADASRLLSRAMQRAVYEYLLSLDALTPEETEAAEAAVDIEIDSSRLIGAEEVAELASRQPVPVVEDEEPEPEPELEPEPVAEALLDWITEAADDAEPLGEPARRSRFRLFHRGGAASPEAEEPPEAPADEPDEASGPRSPDWWTGPADPPAMPVPAEATHVPEAPHDGFHLTEYEDFVSAPAPAPPSSIDRPALEQWAAAGAGPASPAAPVEAAAPLEAAAPPVEIPRPAEAPLRAWPAPPTVEDDDEQLPRGWHVRSSVKEPIPAEPGVRADELAALLDAEEVTQGHGLDLDPKVSAARDEINDRLRRRRCDEAASLVQKLAGDVGGRVVAELALDAGDRCRALGKGNAALSCYIAASRADPDFEAPLLRLADVCLDDRDIDLAVTYLDRVARLHRMRGDTRGALRLYRKIATIAPYRDDILATLMRANSTGQFED
ncbi:MAG: tetratricopeptide repeat protein [Candidatus Dormibacteria bacterium]